MAEDVERQHDRPIPPPRVVVLGVGNLLRRDEGIGVRVVQELATRYRFPPQVTLVDGGTAGLRLLPLLEGADRLIIVDAVDVGAAPGTVLVLRPEDAEVAPRPAISLHEMGPLEVLAMLEATTGRHPPTTIVGIQPADLSPWNETLSEPVARALPEAVARTLAELRRWGVPGESIRVTRSTARR